MSYGTKSCMTSSLYKAVRIVALGVSIPYPSQPM